MVSENLAIAEDATIAHLQEKLEETRAQKAYIQAWNDITEICQRFTDELWDSTLPDFSTSDEAHNAFLVEFVTALANKDELEIGRLIRPYFVRMALFELNYAKDNAHKRFDDFDQQDDLVEWAEHTIKILEQSK
ncbi:MAG: hypothetical protein AAF478_13715 [Pseudomonadota bacterium]